jgi:hypothetical protein
MNWNVKGSWIISSPETLLPTSFNSRLVIQVSEIAGYRPTWLWAGFFYQYLDLPFNVDGGLVRVSRKIHVPIQDSLLFTPEKYQPDYQLKFIKVDWIDSLILTIYEDSMPLNFEPVINIPSQIASSATSTTVPISATSVSLLAANANRKKLTVANNSNQDLFIDLDATASVADHAIKIPKVTNSGFIATYELEQYTGVVSGIWAASGSGAALVRELV